MEINSKGSRPYRGPYSPDFKGDDVGGYAVALAHVQYKRGEPVPSEYEKTSLWIALETTLKTNPRDYVRAVVSMLPKQVDIDSTITRVSEIDKVIEAIHEKLNDKPASVEDRHVH